MGVPKFASWLEKKYPEVATDVCPSKVHGLYIDLNGVIHPCCHSDSDPSVALRPEEEKLRLICHEVEVLVANVRPREILYIAADGVAPRSKINQQRARRYMSAAKLLTSGAEVVGEIVNEFALHELAEVDDELDDVRRSLMNDAMYGGTLIVDDTPFSDLFFLETSDVGLDTEKQKTGLAEEAKFSFENCEKNSGSFLSTVNDLYNKEKIQTTLFDSSCISPGTVFMSKVADAIIAMVQNKLTSDDLLWAELRVVVSGSSIPGEGEQKIFNFLRTQSSYAGFNGRGAHVIAGLDADLIFLALSLHIPHIFILRDNNRSRYREKKKKFDSKTHGLKKNRNRDFCDDIQSVDSAFSDDRDSNVGVCTIDDNKRKRMGLNTSSTCIGNNNNNNNNTNNNKGRGEMRFECFESNLKYRYYAIDILGSCFVSELHGLCEVKKFSAVSKESFSPETLVSSNGYHFFRHAGCADGEIRELLPVVGQKYQHEKSWREFKPCNSHANSKIIDDIIVMAMLMGNDFLPRLPSAFCGESALDNLMELYVTDVLPHGFLTNGYHEINLRQLQRLFESYAKIEAVFFRRFLLNRNKATMEELAGVLHSSFDECWREPYLKSTGLFGDVDGACKKYIEGLCFVWRYYSSNSGGCSWSWYYPFYYAPFALDLADYLQRCNMNLLPMPSPPSLEATPPDTFLQLLCVLPPTSRAFLPAVLGDAILCPPEELRNSFPTTWQVDYSTAYEKDHFATVLLPFPDFSGLCALVEETQSRFTEEEQRRRKQLDYCIVLSSSKGLFELHGDISELSAGDAALFGPLCDGVTYMRLRDSLPERSRPRTYSCSSTFFFCLCGPQRGANLKRYKPRRQRRKVMDNAAIKETVTVINKGPSFASYLIGVAVVSLLTTVALLPWPSPLFLQVFALNIGAITLSFLIGIAVHDPVTGSGIQRNNIPGTYVDWLCAECNFPNFAVNDKCFLCRAPFSAERCLAVFSGTESVTPPLYDPDHTQHTKTFFLDIQD